MNNIKAKLNTPQQLKLYLYLSLAASVILGLSTLLGIRQQQQAIETVGKNSAPSILASQQIKESLADMDANAVNELLVKPGENSKAVAIYNGDYQKLVKQLIVATENITYGDEERTPISDMQLNLAPYMKYIERARVANEMGDEKNLLINYQAARDIVDQKLLMAADELNEVNSRYLDKAYGTQKMTSWIYFSLIILSGLGLISILSVTQIFLYQRMRRRLNPMLLAATVIAILFLGYTTLAFMAATRHLKVAKEDAFDSLNFLRQTVALAYIANAAESRYLLDPASANVYEQSFMDNKTKIDGLMTKELNNITFEGEQQAAENAVSKFKVYLQLDQQIRSLQSSGDHTQAISLCTGYAEGQSNWAFEQFIKAQEQVIEINKKAFDDNLEKAVSDVTGFELITPVGVGAIAILTFLGLQPRLREYYA